ncbi:MAG: DUF4011 domain-containing protein [Cyclobacteriaceae bacterium]|nr:DUF4011 domain-containing protein [Cyclobacteriaceae bacterium]
MNDTTKKILRSYLRKLTNLTGNNRSLLLLRLHAEQLLDLHDLSFLNGERSFGIINALIAGKEKKLCPVLDSRMEASNEVSKRLKKLQRIDHFIFEERGSTDLHVGWPFVKGKFSDGTMVRCPLLFFPVALLQENKSWILHLREDAGITFNKSFLLAYSFYNKVTLEEDLLETDFEDFNVDSTVFRTEVYQLLKDKIEINFNPDNFRDELIKFQDFKKEEFDQSHRNGELKLFPEAVLGIFPQAASQLVPDYLQLIENESITDLEEFFLTRHAPESESLTATDSFMDLSVKEEKMYTPFVLDAYQENAIRASKHGHSVVVQGPPGTGKSQLIANLLADAIASGKRALLVCQKRAALDVVYERLKKINLGDFLGLVHDFRNDRKDIFSKVARQIESIDAYKARNRSVDAIQMERSFLQGSRIIDQIAEELGSFKNYLFDERECGISIKELYLTSDPNSPSINIRQEYQYFTFSMLHDFLRKLKSYAHYAVTIEQEDYPWRDRKSFAAYQLSDLKEIQKTVKDIPVFQREVSDQIKALIGTALTLEDCDALRAREDDMLGMIALLQHPETYRYFLAMEMETEDETSALWFSNVERVTMNCFQDAGPEVSLLHHDLGKFLEALQKRMKARRNIFRLLWWELFSEHKFWIKRVLVNNGLLYNKSGLQSLEQRLDNRLNLEHLLTGLNEKKWLIDLPENYQAENFQEWFDRQKLAIRAKRIFASLREVRGAINAQQYTQDGFVSLIESIIRAVRYIPQHKAGWLTYLSPFQVMQLTQNPALEENFLQTLSRDFDSLCEFDKLKESIQPYEKDVILKLNDATATWDAEQLERLFQNSIRLAWIDHIEVKYPVLRSVSSLKMTELQAELQQRIVEKQKLSEEILLLRARERVCDAIEYNRLNNRITYRDLHHQITKKKKVWPLRKIIAAFDQDIFQLLPCWLASPESVSAIFPMTDLFDLVIFDEASQCFAERGIPAMYRGKQVLVAGDTMQLKPNELYQVRWEEEADHPDLEVESLLDLSARYLTTVHLQGHYRSKSLELIDFSNRTFYRGRLQMLPDRDVLNQREPGIAYCKVEGVWENNTNRVEALYVAEKVFTLLQENSDKEIGIVTFNAAQQLLVMDLVEEVFQQAGRAVPSSLFIKNIENVQGDEKDIIIFSVGYAPDKKGKMVMQFGSLNAAGGENRLNVAVTRAREKVILVSSIWPEDLRTSELKNEGPKILQQYLAYARDVDRKSFKPAVQYEVHQSAAWYLSSRLVNWAKHKFPDSQFEINSLPFSDMHILHNQNSAAIILTDDTRYLISQNIKDPHAYTPSLLAKKHWDFQMIFSRNYWQSREKVEADLTLFIGSRIREQLPVK